MQNLPTAEIYEKEYKYMPWGVLSDEVLRTIVNIAPKNGVLVDLMCGTGYLLGKIKKERPDLKLVGIDFEKEYIQFAHNNYKNIQFIHADATDWKSETKADIVLCTSGIHHLPYEKQEPFIIKLQETIKPRGVVITGDPCIDEYNNEAERKIASARLGFEYLVEVIKNRATTDVIDATISILKNDVMGVEYKTSVVKQKQIFKKYFSKVDEHKIWPKDAGNYGDYYFILS